MKPPAEAIWAMMWMGACLAFLLTVALGLLFNLLERIGRNKARRRLDRFGSRLDGR